MSSINEYDNIKETTSLKSKETKENDNDKENNIDHDKEFDKDKDKEKETSNLLDNREKISGETSDIPDRLGNENELYCFLLLGSFLFIVYSLAKLKSKTPLNIHENIIDQTFYEYGIESNETIKNFDNRFKRLYPDYTLELRNAFPTKEDTFTRRLLYVNGENLTNRYVKHMRPVNETLEQPYEEELYKNLIPNDTFSEDRQNFIKTKNYIEICEGENQIYKVIKSDTSKPLISIILPAYNKKNQIIKTIRSIQHQTLKNIEIIIVDDLSTENSTDVYNHLLENDNRIRVLYHLKHMGIFKTRIDGFLYSRGPYILHFNPGDLFADNFVLEDVYNLIIKYNLDSVRFAFTQYKDKINNEYTTKTYFYPNEDLKIKYEKAEGNKNKKSFEYETIFNRLIRANVISKSLDLVDSFIINAYKNIKSDIWWNVLIDNMGNGKVAINRVGYLYFSSYSGETKYNISNEEERDKTIQEIILEWLFNYEVGPKYGNKKNIVNIFRTYNSLKYYNGVPIRLDYLRSNFTSFEYFLGVLINDIFVEDNDKSFLRALLSNYTERIINITNYLNSLNITNNTTSNPI